MVTDWHLSPTAADLRLQALPAYETALQARPAGRYASFSRVGDILYSSGVVGRENGQIIDGQLTGAACVARGERAAAAAAIAIVRAVRDELGGLDRVVKVVALNGYLNAASSFQGHIQVMNAASTAIAEIFPDSPMPARTTVGVSSLPGGGAVEVSMLIQFALSPDDEVVTPRV